MKKLHVLFTIAIWLLISTPILWSQSSLPSKVQETELGLVPNRISEMVVTNDNNYIIMTDNLSISDGQKLINLDTQFNKAWEIALNIPCHSFAPTNCLVASNTTNGALLVANDTLFIYDANGNVTAKIKTPGENSITKNNKMIFRDHEHYYIVDFSSVSGQQFVYIYGNDLSPIKSFLLNSNHGEIGGFISVNNGETFYIATCQNGGGDSSNISSNLDKYSGDGNLIWSQHLPDCLNPTICMGKDESIYIFSTLFFHTATDMAFDVVKFSPSGSQEWEKLWLGGYAGDSISQNLYGSTIVACGSGVIIFGSATCLGQDPNSPNFDVNDVDAVAIGYDSMGNLIWNTRLADPTGGGNFIYAQWDKEGYLLVGGRLARMSKIWKYYVPGVTAVTTENNNMPSSFTLSQNYPNPFNPTTTINFSLPKSGQVTLKVYDLLGKEVATLVSGLLSAGEHKIEFNSRRYSISSGIYLYSLISSDFKCTKKMMLLK